MPVHRRQICKVSTEGNSCRVTLPRTAAFAIGLGVGDYVAATVVGKCIVLVKVNDEIERAIVTTTNDLMNGLLAETSK